MHYPNSNCSHGILKVGWAGKGFYGFHTVSSTVRANCTVNTVHYMLCDTRCFMFTVKCTLRQCCTPNKAN